MTKSKEEVTKTNQVKLLDKMEQEAVDMMGQFKEHPIKSVIIAIIVLWGIKKIQAIINS